MKTVRTLTYNYDFDENNGRFARWGRTFQDDPQYSPIGPEILDCEVSTICHQGCKFCYKSNISKGENMSFATFKTVLDKMPTVTQVAFGVGSIDANPELFGMMGYCRAKGVVPNITINGCRLNDEILDSLASLCGAVAVSCYDKEICYNAVKALTKRGLKQVNIHYMLSKETLQGAYDLQWDTMGDPRLRYLNAIVFLSLKKKGRGLGYTSVSQEEFAALVNSYLDRHMRIGFDSCGCHKFLEATKDRIDYDELVKNSEPCESTLFSSYVNVKGEFYPCSFCEMGQGIDVVNCEDFLQDVWFSNSVKRWRKNLLQNGRKCPYYEI